MKCSNCQKEFFEGQFCPSCGFDNLAPAQTEAKTCPACGKKIEHGHFCPACGCDVDHPETNNKRHTPHRVCLNCGANMTHERFCLVCGYDNPKASFHNIGTRGMKWYKFLVWFSLFAAAISALYNFGYYLSIYWVGLLHGDLDELFPQVEEIDMPFFLTTFASFMLFAIMYLAFAALALFTRSKLVKYKKDAPRYIVGLYVASALLSFGQLVLDSIMGISVGSSIIGMITAFVMAVLNYNYFENRSDLFIN
ncbi:MAG: zinc ribbon domain-containing protein [Clostridia bacterium]|nr:zinc ribbon domain-containing protein [Clostridia bacterium]